MNGPVLMVLLITSTNICDDYYAKREQPLTTADDQVLEEPAFDTAQSNDKSDIT
jgi:hypothetical protein